MLVAATARRQARFHDRRRPGWPRAPLAPQIECAARMAHNAAPTQKLQGNEWRAVRLLIPYLAEYKWRVLLALACLITAKLANVGVPLVMKSVVDRLDVQTAMVAVPVALLATYDWRFAAITFGAVIVYLAFTVAVTEWRMAIRRQANELDSRANTRAVDSLLNYETVKYFGNEEYEARRYDENLRKY